MNLRQPLIYEHERADFPHRKARMVRWCRMDSLYVPPALAALSLVYLVGKKLWTVIGRGKNKGEGAEGASIALDGLNIFAFRLLRILTIFTLVSLELFALSVGQSSRTNLFQTLFHVSYLHSDYAFQSLIKLQLYASVLAILTVSVSAHWRDVASWHLSTLMFAELVVYGALDVWPYATYYLEPIDPGSDPTTWVRIAMLVLSGLVIPLVMPRPFRPLTPGAKPSAEDTVSLLSLYSFAFLDNLVFRANRVGNVTPDDMPELVETDMIEHISKRASSILDSEGNKNRHVMLSTAIIWSR